MKTKYDEHRFGGMPLAKRSTDYARAIVYNNKTISVDELRKATENKFGSCPLCEASLKEIIRFCQVHPISKPQSALATWSGLLRTEYKRRKIAF